MTSLVQIHTGSEEPLYNIGVVSRMTKISMATLRAWERRYEFPESKRTMGGHRLYSEKDIIRLRWVKERVDEGMQTAQAIHALRHQEQTGQAVLTEEDFRELTPARIERMDAIDKGDREDRRSFSASVQERLLYALLHHNTQQADQLVADALAVLSPEVVILDIIRSVLNEVGELWQQDKISIANEHLATNYLRQRLLMWMVSGPPPRTQHSIVLACAPDEWHEGSLLILGALLRRRLWPIVYLGQSVPLPDLASFVHDVNPSMVVLNAMTEETAKNLMDWPKLLPDVVSKGRPVVGFGGRVFVEKPEWRLKIAGIYLGNNFEEGISTIEKLLRD